MSRRKQIRPRVADRPCTILTRSEIKAGGYISVKEAAARGWSNRHLIYYYLRTGDIPVAKSANGRLVVREDDLRAHFGEKSFGVPQKYSKKSCYIYKDGIPIGMKLGTIKRKKRRKTSRTLWPQPVLPIQKPAAEKEEPKPKRGFFARIFGL